MKILVLATAYPSEESPISLMYIHTRNLYYSQNGFDVTVLNFAAKDSYEWDGLKVISLKDYNAQNDDYDIALAHAPNLRNHYLFLKKNEKRFKRIVFFFHGHEVLYQSKVYSKPYWYVKKNPVKQFLQDAYDRFKLQMWHNYFPKLAHKSTFVFVSRWMLNEFKKWVRLSEEDLKNHVSITYNGIGQKFENLQYDSECEKKYDFVTIRGFLDGSKYAVDIVCKLAEAYPQYSFLVIGKGKFFDFNKKPENLEWKDMYCNHDEIIMYLNQSKCALMPTRTDAQGVMACEMATFGMPLITSDIEVCHEVFEGFGNVAFVDNEVPTERFDQIYQRVCKEYQTACNRKYYAGETMKNELQLFEEIVKNLEECE